MKIDKNRILAISNSNEFERLAFEIFNFQRKNNPLYAKFCHHLIANRQPQTIDEIPFLPIEFFKTHKVQTGIFDPEVEYQSSGTSGSVRSKHYIESKAFYLATCKKNFELFYGPLSNFRILALLPSYLERRGSSLIDMVDFFIKESNPKLGGFYLSNTKELIGELKKDFDGKTLLIGVTFGLLDLSETTEIDLSNVIVMETGGMKGRRKERIRSDVHQQLKKAFSVPKIHSEYGMTELHSQAYSTEKGLFDTPPWMRVLIRQTTDPFTYVTHKKTGGINIIDLANLCSCSFIQTQDLGKTYKNKQFEVLGRFDESDVRGCNLLIK